MKQTRNNIKKVIQVLVFACEMNVFSVATLRVVTNSKFNITKHVHMKHVLFWSPMNSTPFNVFRDMNYSHNCPINNCYFTTKRDHFGGGIKNFDAILFNAADTEKWYINNLPTQRYAHQKYVFVSSESTINYPVCTTLFDNFFNWTWTYKLDSDCPLRYFTITNMKDEIVGPKTHMDWTDMKRGDNVMQYYNSLSNINRAVNNSLRKELTGKTKAAAWFVSNCRTPSNRSDIVSRLQEALEEYDLRVDIYGSCGLYKCVRNSKECDRILKKDYYFYMALENSICEDYVTEKVLRAVRHLVIPIVLSGARHERFLPPKSYLTISKRNYKNVAKRMNNLIRNPDWYSQYFKWKQYYKYKANGFEQSLCDFCALLNDSNKTKTSSVYTDFRSWWNPNYKKDCGANAAEGRKEKLELYTALLQSLRSL